MEYIAKKEMMKWATAQQSDGGINVNDDGRDDKKILNEINAIVESFRNLNEQALAVYTPMVEDICSRKSVSTKELEHLLDWLVSICISDDMTELFKRVCRHFYYQYPELITDYVYLYKEMYEDDMD